MAATPHELREGLLQLARDILESQSRAKIQEQSNRNVFSGNDIITTEQIIAEAMKLNNFVSMKPTESPTNADQLRGTESRSIADTIVKINGIPFLLVAGTLATHASNWSLAGFSPSKK